MTAVASGQLAAHLRFLADAAHLLRGSAPETSAHLMRHRADRLLHARLEPHELQRQHVCAACGHIMMPGRGTTLRLEPPAARKSRPAGRRRRRGPRDAEAAAPGPSKALTCGRCRRVTSVDLPAPAPAVRRRAAKPPPPENKGKPEPKLSANASSKKRAKSRKAGLQALLASRQHKPALTLADFGNN